MASPDCIIIGGGIVGLSIARRLRGESLTVRLLERGACGREASWAGAGLLCLSDPGRQDVFAQFNDRSVHRFAKFCAALRDESGIDPEFEACGELCVFFDGDDECHRLEGVARAAAANGDSASFEWLDRAAVRQVEPQLGDDVAGGLLVHRNCVVRNPRLLAAARGACTKAGVEVCEHDGVSGLLRDGDRVIGVAAESGRHLADLVILASGSWSSQLDDKLSSLMPVTPVKGQMALLRTPERTMARSVSRGHHYVVPRRDGQVLVGATVEPDAGFNVRNTPAGIAELLREGLRLVSGLAEGEVERLWAGLRPGTPDGHPYLGEVPGMPGLFAASGHFRTGLTLAPETAEYVAAAVTGRPYDLDLSPCRPGRPLPPGSAP